MARQETFDTVDAMERLIAWVDGIDVPMCVIALRPGDRLEFVHANAALTRVTDMPFAEFIGNSPLERFPPRMAERLETNIRQCLTGQAPISYEGCAMLDGKETWWQTTLSKPHGFDGKVVLGVTAPITDAKEREFAAAEALADMAERFDEMRLFTTMAAHDARSPLATVSSLIELVLEDFNDFGDGKSELLRLASNTVDEALTQITATLERARTLERETPPHKAVDLGRLCADIAAMVDPEKVLAIEAPKAHVECDEVLVQMALRNLMSNAARYCDHHITVALSDDAPRGIVHIDIADDGPGLPEGTTLQYLTQKGEERSGAHGFGLRAIAKLVTSRGGAFEVLKPDMDEDMSGARFRIVLPGRILAHPSPVVGPPVPDTPVAVLGL
ncbi:PAS domain-containing sensor histidine kinase [Rhodobacteraceae bacterium M385]|nr:PAS domain-containing sensor histidine kinase [Rhodobacteraceae bacterium M385]